MADDMVTIFTDGAARGNPGPAAWAYVITAPGRPSTEHAERLGIATNNVAEYTALIQALTRAADLALRRVSVFSDSELMVKQMNGEYSVKNADLKELYEQAQSVRRRFDSFSLTHVRRKDNRRADQLCNDVLDDRPLGAAVPLSPKPRKKAPATRRSDTDEQAVACLQAAATAWTNRDPRAPTPEQVWDQLWTVLEESGVLKARRSK
jgi:ribonuclease HI